MTISGESIDYGPCAFMDTYDPATVFSSIDHGGRYAYGNQPEIGQWNLARLAEAMLPLLAPDTDDAIALAMPVLRSYAERFDRYWLDGMRAKLGLSGSDEGDRALVDDLLSLLRDQPLDFTTFFRSLGAVTRGAAGAPDGLEAWTGRWEQRRQAGATSADEMDRVNPIYIPRNHLVEEALAAATAGDSAPYERLVEVVTRPFDERPGFERYAEPAPADFGRYRTFCGT
jgi:serine/tyrosine/threonine adenylyltransferase